MWGDEMWNENEPPIIDCVVLECKNKSPFYLCTEHLGYFYERQMKFLICWECNSIIKLLPPNFGSTPNKFIFCEHCRKCGNSNDERKIVLDNNKIL